MSKFEPGTSGNPKGRPKGKETHSTHIRKLLQMHSEALTNKLIEMALGGDISAHKLIFERICPRSERAPLDINLPDEINLTTLPEMKSLILRAAIEGKISVGEAEQLVGLINHQVGTNPPPLAVPIIPIDPVEASKVYQQWMRDS